MGLLLAAFAPLAWTLLGLWVGIRGERVGAGAARWPLECRASALAWRPRDESAARSSRRRQSPSGRVASERCRWQDGIASGARLGGRGGDRDSARSGRRAAAAAAEEEEDRARGQRGWRDWLLF